MLSLCYQTGESIKKWFLNVVSEKALSVILHYLVKGLIYGKG